MPGMMDTILNLGLNDDAVAGLARSTGNARFALDSYRRLIQMYGEVVDDIDGHRFEQALADLKRERGVQQDVDLSADDLASLIETFKRIYKQETGNEFPQDRARAAAPRGRRGLRVVEEPRARRCTGARTTIPDDIGTAVNVVQMVFGNKGDRSATGVCFTRDPSTGETRAVRRVPRERAGRGRRRRASARRSRSRRCATRLPEAFDAAARHDDAARAALPRHAGHRVHGRGRTGSTCCRRARRSAPPPRRCKAAVDMTGEGLISREEAIVRIDPSQLDQLLHPMIDPEARVRGRGTRSERVTRRGVRRRSSSTPTRPRSAARPGSR